tara:strand:- start:6057 stop:6752 length:696 start_codon:yes stop_codon:yes gene_type:complete
MAIQLTQINSEGQALQCGLDVFISIPVYDGEYLSYGDSFLLQTINGASDYASSTADYASEVISSAPATNADVWYRYHTEGTSYPAVISPSSSTNMLSMIGVFSTVPSHSGMYQKLSGLLTGNEYQVTINFHKDTVVGNLSFSRFYYANENFSTAIQTDVTVYTLPTPQITFSFTASSISDIVFFDFSTTEVSSSGNISSIKIQEKNNYQMVVVTELENGNICKVLRRKIEQ